MDLGEKLSLLLGIAALTVSIIALVRTWQFNNRQVEHQRKIAELTAKQTEQDRSVSDLAAKQLAILNEREIPRLAVRLVNEWGRIQIKVENVGEAAARNIQTSLRVLVGLALPLSSARRQDLAHIAEIKKGGHKLIETELQDGQSGIWEGDCTWADEQGRTSRDKFELKWPATTRV